MGRVRAVRRGEIWLVDLGTTVGSEIRNARPAVVIQNDIGNAYSPTTIVAPVTSKHVDRLHPTDVALGKQSGLSQPSKALCNQIRAVDKRRLVKRVGEVKTMLELDEALRVSLGLVTIP